MTLVFAATLVVLLVAVSAAGVPPDLRRLLVEGPIRWLDRLGPGRAVFYAILGAAGLALFVLFEIEGLRLFAFLAPELIVWFAIFDVALYADILILGVTVASASRLPAVARELPALVRRVGERLGRPRARRRAAGSRPPQSPGDRTQDPEPAAVVYLA